MLTIAPAPELGLEDRIGVRRPVHGAMPLAIDARVAFAAGDGVHGLEARGDGAHVEGASTHGQVEEGVRRRGVRRLSSWGLCPRAVRPGEAEETRDEHEGGSTGRHASSVARSRRAHGPR